MPVAVSPAVEIKVNSGSYVTAVGGVDVAAGDVVTIRLVSTNVDSWYCQCISTDDLSDKDAINAGATPDPVAHTLTFTVPAGSPGRTFRFESVVNGMLTQQRLDSSLRTTFALYVLTTGGRRVLAADEQLESDPVFGYIASVNSLIRNPSPGSGEANTTSNVGDANAISLTEAKSGVNIPVRKVIGLKSTVVGLNGDGHTVEVDADGVATATVATTGNISGLTTLDGGSPISRPLSRIVFSGVAPTLRSLADGIDKRRPLILVAQGGPLVIVDEYAPDTAATRIRTGTGANITIAQNGAVQLDYDASGSRWRVVGGVGGTSFSAPGDAGEPLLSGGGGTVTALAIDNGGADDGKLIGIVGTAATKVPGISVPSLAEGELIAGNGTGGLQNEGYLHSWVQFTFPSDANATLNATQSKADAIKINSGVISATRQLRSAKAPNGRRRMVVRNDNSHAVDFGWSTGTLITVAPNTQAIIGDDATNAVLVLQGENGSGAGDATLQEDTVTTDGHGDAILCQTYDISGLPDGFYRFTLKAIGDAGVDANNWGCGIAIERTMLVAIRSGVLTQGTASTLVYCDWVDGLDDGGPRPNTADAFMTSGSGNAEIEALVVGEDATKIDWKTQMSYIFVAAISEGGGWGGGAFDPTSIANLLAWYKSDAGVTVAGANVTNVADQSGTGDTHKNLVKAGSGNITFNASDASFNNKPSMSFGGGPRLEGSGAWTSAPSQPLTFYWVGKGTTGIVFSGNSTRCQMQIATGAHYQLYCGSFATDAGATDLAIAHTHAFVFNGASTAVYADNPSSAAFTGSPGTQASDQVVVGDFAGGANPFNGTFCELLVYAGAHDATQRANVMGYLKAKYGTP